MLRAVAFLCLIAAFSSAAYLGYEIYTYKQSTPIAKLQGLWREDMDALEDSGALPKEWKSIKEIELMPKNDETKVWFQNLQIPVVLAKDGQYRLQILFVPWEEDGSKGVFIQYDLVDLKSENSNTVWERSRTFMLDDNLTFKERLKDTLKELF